MTHTNKYEEAQDVFEHYMRGTFVKPEILDPVKETIREALKICAALEGELTKTPESIADAQRQRYLKEFFDQLKKEVE